jgi:hypothetical protein
MNRRSILTLLGRATFGHISIPHAFAQDSDRTSQAHIAWVGEVLDRMDTIKPGMTRERLLTVFTTEGGLSTRDQQTYVSSDCPLFKVNVTFRPFNPTYDHEGRLDLFKDERDTILTISQPYVVYSVMD